MTHSVSVDSTAGSREGTSVLGPNLILITGTISVSGSSSQEDINFNGEVNEDVEYVLLANCANTSNKANGAQLIERAGGDNHAELNVENSDDNVRFTAILQVKNG